MSATVIHHFRNFRPNPEAERWFASFVQTPEDRAAIHQWRMDENAAAVRGIKDNQISMTETRAS